MLLKETSFPKTGNDDVLKISTDIKSFIMRMQNEMKNKDNYNKRYMLKSSTGQKRNIRN